MKLHGRSDAALPRQLLFARPQAPVWKVYPFFLHIFAETIKIFLQKRIVYVKILLDFFV